VSLHYALLGLLSYMPMTGYDLKKMFDQSIKNLWAAHISQIYRELGELEKEWYVTFEIKEQQDRPDKKIYSITKDGRLAFQRWLFDPPEKLSKEVRDEFMLRVFFGAELGRDELIALLERFHEQKKLERDTLLPEISRSIDQYAKVVDAQKKVPSWRLVEKRVIMTNKMLLRWSEECIKELKERR
jgi:PadR family transcriptional regulator AphA